MHQCQSVIQFVTFHLSRSMSLSPKIFFFFVIEMRSKPFFLFTLLDIYSNLDHYLFTFEPPQYNFLISTSESPNIEISARTCTRHRHGHDGDISMLGFKFRHWPKLLSLTLALTTIRATSFSLLKLHSPFYKTRSVSVQAKFQVIRFNIIGHSNFDGHLLYCE